MNRGIKPAHANTDPAMTSLQLILVLVASIWAAMNTLIAGYNAVNGTRDRVVTGHTDEGIPLTVPHRRIMYRNDWLPMKVGLASVRVTNGFYTFNAPTSALGDFRTR